MNKQSQTAYKAGTSRHMAICLELLENMDNKMLIECFTHDVNNRPDAKQIRKELQKLRKQGYKYFPCCDNTNSVGACAGHTQ